MSDLSVPGSVDIVTLNITDTTETVTIDIKNLFIEINLFEDIYKNYVSGSISLVDAKGLLESLPIIGEETLSIAWKTSGFPNDNLMLHKFRIYSLEAKSSENNKSFYILNFVSPELITSEAKKISKAYNGFSHDIIKNILGSNGLETIKPYSYEESTNNIKFISNYWTPLQSIDFCATKALNARAGSASFLFFENLNGYHFKSVDKLFHQSYDINWLTEKSRNYVFDNNLKRDSKNKYLSLRNLYSNTQFNHLKRLLSGAYANRVVEFDTTKKIYSNRAYNYWYNFESSNHAGEHPAASHYVDFDDNDLRVSVRPTFSHAFNGLHHDNSALIESMRLPLLSQLEFISFTAEIFGRTDLFAGDLISLNINSSKELITEEKNKFHYDRLLSGRWLISSIGHKIKMDTASNRPIHTMTMDILKDSFREAVF